MKRQKSQLSKHQMQPQTRSKQRRSIESNGLTMERKFWLEIRSEPSMCTTLERYLLLVLLRNGTSLKILSKKWLQIPPPTFPQLLMSNNPFKCKRQSNNNYCYNAILYYNLTSCITSFYVTSKKQIDAALFLAPYRLCLDRHYAFLVSFLW